MVLKVTLPQLLRERLRSLGIFTGERLLLLKVSARKNLYLVQVLRSGAKVAVDGETAAGITVWQTA